MIAPFVLGAALAASLQDRHDLFTEGVTRGEAMLFLGAAMCITAFPMLARIIHERGLSGTSLGTLALAAGAIDDAAAWGVLAVVLASFGNEVGIAVAAIGGGTIYAVLVLTLGRRLLRRLGRMAEKSGDVSQQMIAVVLMVVMLGAWFTDVIGIYAVFGAFIMGIAMPRGVFAAKVQEKLGPLVTVFLLPLFFTYSGLNTRLDLVDSPELWLLTLWILGAACLGKGAACWLAARLNGEPNRDALAIGTLMNARGLMELIILNIGLQQGIITDTLFSLMVIMAIVTTLMATPLFEFVYGRRRASSA